MRTCSILICLWFSLSQLSGQSPAHWAKLSPDLQAHLSGPVPTVIPVFVMAQEGLDVLSVQEQLNKQRADLATRTETTIRYLQNESQAFETAMATWIAQQPPAERMSLRFYWISKSFYLEATPAQLHSLTQHPAVGHILSVPEPILLRAKPVAPPLPDDREIGHDAIGAPEMWKRGYTGNGRKVLVIDSGTDASHPALRDNFHGRFVPSSQAWFNPEGVIAPEDCNGHGSHVTGTVVGLDRAMHDTIGVAFNGTWMASPSIVCPGTYSTLDVLQWAIDPDGDPTTTADMPDVINNSWGVRNPSPNNCIPNPFIDAIDALETAGVALVFAAGNDSLPQSVNFPANLARGLVNTMAVGAIDPKDMLYPRAEFSSQGPTICQATGAEAIKPEVMAPGVTTRSVRLGGGYTWFAGTSMATPHVAGAIMLLKEAFPYLSGQELKLALYQHAMDLGPIGEDNAYGNGIIQVPAAFDALVAAGNQPVVVSTAINPGISGLATQGFCGTPATVAFSLHNFGQVALDSVAIRYQWNDQAAENTLLWQGNLMVEGELTLQLPPRVLNPGVYQVRVEIIEVQGRSDYFFLDNLLEVEVLVQPAITASAEASLACAGASARLTATLSDSSAEARWYSRPVGGPLLGTGAVWTSPTLSAPDTFYMGYTLAGQVGLPDNSAGTGTYDPENQGKLVFDCHFPAILEAVTVYSLLPGEQRFVLRDAQGAELAAKNVPLGTGQQRVSLGFFLPRAEGLRLELDESSTGGLYYSISIPQYPYGYQNIIDITGGLDANNPKDFYYYFYDWSVSISSPCARIEVPVSIGAGNSLAEFEMSSDIVDLSSDPAIQFMDQSTGATSWQWDFGDGQSATDPNPLHTFTQAGIYPVVLQVTDPDGCTAATQQSVEVFNSYAYPVANTPLQTPQLRMRVYPNPAQHMIKVDFDGQRLFPESWTIRDLQGRIVERGQFTGQTDTHWEIALPRLASGLYLLQVKDKTQLYAHPIQIQQP